MKTIHPIGLARLIATHQPFDLIDVRTKEEFDKAHIPGARSIPLPELRASKVLRDRKLPATEPLYVICRSRVLAGLASGILEGAGCANAVVVDGGMETWQAQGLPGRAQKMVPENCHRCSDARSGCWIRVRSRPRYSRSVLCPAINCGVCRSGSENLFVRSTTDAAQNNIVDLAQTGPREDWAVPARFPLRSSSWRADDFFPIRITASASPSVTEGRKTSPTETRSTISSFLRRP